MAVNNAVAPKLILESNKARNSSNEFVLNFSENVTLLNRATEEQLREDFILRDETKNSDSNLIKTVDYTVVTQAQDGNLAGNQVKITVKDAEANKNPITVQVREGAKYLVATANQAKTVQASDRMTVQPFSQSVTATQVTYTEFTQGQVAKAATAEEAGIRLVQQKAGAAANGKTVNLVINSGATEPVALNADRTEIEINDDATLQNIVDFINKDKDNVGATYTAVLTGTGTAKPTAAVTFTFANGENPTENSLTVHLNQAVTIVGKVEIRNATNPSVNSKFYDVTPSTATKSFTVTGLGDRDVIGEELVATVRDGGKDYILKYVIGKNQK